MSKTSPTDGLVLGLNSSTQSLSAVLIDPKAGEVVWQHSVNYGEALGDEFGLKSGFVATGSGVVVSPPLMWVRGLELMFDRLLSELGISMIERIKRISGAGQQHGTVYLSAAAEAILEELDPSGPMCEQLSKGFFTRELSPIWMDSSTGDQCRLYRQLLDGPVSVAERTGSFPTERFSGPQILRFAMTDPLGYQRTAHIALVSSFICSCIVGKIAPMESGDAAGMNLMDIEDGDHWNMAVIQGLNVLASGLPTRLPGIVSASTTVGRVSRYLQDRYHFASDATVMAFSGDNPDSLRGMGVLSADSSAATVISLGTSDTAFRLTDQTHDPLGRANVFSFSGKTRMALLCFKNGSLAREQVKQRYFGADPDWSKFEHALKSTPSGNEGRFMLPFFRPEIVPFTNNQPVVEYHGGLDSQDGPACARAVVEAQFLNIALQLERLGKKPETIRVTGGAAVNASILQIAADVLDTELALMEAPGGEGKIVTDSVSRGAALRGAMSLGYSVEELSGKFCKPQGKRIVPRNAAAYSGLREKFAQATNRFQRTD